MLGGKSQIWPHWHVLELQVLRFFCVWDDRRSLFGDRRPYRLHYFLEDATLEVLETADNNNGRDPFPVFLRRGPLPRVSIVISQCACHTDLCQFSMTL